MVRDAGREEPNEGYTNQTLRITDELQLLRNVGMVSGKHGVSLGAPVFRAGLNRKSAWERDWASVFTR